MTLARAWAAAIAALGKQGFVGGCEDRDPIDFIANDPGAPDLPRITLWRSALPCPVPELVGPLPERPAE